MREIKDFPDYFVDIEGNVYSQKIGGHGKTISPVRRKLRPAKDKDGYLVVSLYSERGRYPRRIHRLVLETYIGPRPNGMQACHNDGNPANNKLENLRWGTAKSNQRDRKKHGTSYEGEEHWSSKLTEEKVRQIRELHKTGKYEYRHIAWKFNIDNATVCRIITGKIWKHI